SLILTVSKLTQPSILSREPSSKHFLSEEKMAARFNSLSLDNDHIYSVTRKMDEQLISFLPHFHRNPCTEVVLWSPHSNSLLHTIRTLMAPSSAQPHLEVVANQEEMEI
uniref:Uncharacterized protein n=1 Tax=Naja naja TaxID=35670 RepID=A0A8C7E2F1_NAJNA